METAPKDTSLAKGIMFAAVCMTIFGAVCKLDENKQKKLNAPVRER